MVEKDRCLMIQGLIFWMLSCPTCGHTLFFDVTDTLERISEDDLYDDDEEDDEG